MRIKIEYEGKTAAKLVPARRVIRKFHTGTKEKRIKRGKTIKYLMSNFYSKRKYKEYLTTIRGNLRIVMNQLWKLKQKKWD